LPKHRIAALAATVQKARDQGDAVGRSLIDEAARELALAAGSVAAQLSLGEDGAPYPLVLAGGAFKGCPGLVEPLIRALALPQARPELLAVEPAMGAVRLALELLP
jgi:N-acetylglucosamine kinase-like BadF-type ATPase